ncbi:MAG: hypothetical protein FWF20_09505 [Betaproteobacteria bacterium]|nr:hypothetical protein [Betaproteobacteria bacterium]MCL2886998.1 hypothetical protein [Betaproteobacteria bacterium]
MRAQTISSAQGWRWLTAAYAIFRRNPLLLALLVLIYLLTMAFLNVLPVIGVVAAALLMPGLSVGLMQAARNVEHGQMAGIQTLVGGLRENTRTLLALGMLYLLVTLGILGLSTLIDGGDLLRYLLAANRAEREAALKDADFTLSGLFVAVMATPVLMAWWFAPVLAAWHRQPLGKALFFSFIACWLNWRAFLAYGAALMLFVGILPGILLGFLLALFPVVASFVGSLLAVFMGLVVAPVIFTSFYVSYRDIFGISEIA